MMMRVNQALSVASVAAPLAAWAFGRLAYTRWRQGRDVEFRVVQGLEDPRSRNERWVAEKERPVLLLVGSGALVIASVSGVIVFVAYLLR